MTEQHIEKLTEVIQSRKSVYPKQFTGDKIDREVINWILYNAIQAPSHRKVNPWRFHVLTGLKKKELGDVFKTTYKNNTSADEFSEKKFNSFDQKFSNTSHIFVISMQPNSERPVPEWENVAAVAAAVQNIYLSVTAAGFGGYWSSPASMLQVMENFFGFGEEEKCLGLFYLGVPQNNLPTANTGRQIENFVTWYEQ